MRKLTNLIADESGQDVIEYALFAALIGLASVTAIRGVAADLNSAFLSIGNALEHTHCAPGMSCIGGH
jgi:pilus assembly protein Flp/PilA